MGIFEMRVFVDITREGPFSANQEAKLPSLPVQSHVSPRHR